jgi:hypothetical protein
MLQFHESFAARIKAFGWPYLRRAIFAVVRAGFWWSAVWSGLWIAMVAVGHSPKSPLVGVVVFAFLVGAGIRFMMELLWRRIVIDEQFVIVKHTSWSVRHWFLHDLTELTCVPKGSALLAVEMQIAGKRGPMILRLALRSARPRELQADLKGRWASRR